MRTKLKTLCDSSGGQRCGFRAPRGALACWRQRCLRGILARWKLTSKGVLSLTLTNYGVNHKNGSLKKHEIATKCSCGAALPDGMPQVANLRRSPQSPRLSCAGGAGCCPHWSQCVLGARAGTRRAEMHREQGPETLTLVWGGCPADTGHPRATAEKRSSLTTGTGN